MAEQPDTTSMIKKRVKHSKQSQLDDNILRIKKSVEEQNKIDEEKARKQMEKHDIESKEFRKEREREHTECIQMTEADQESLLFNNEKKAENIKCKKMHEADKASHRLRDEIVKQTK